LTITTVERSNPIRASSSGDLTPQSNTHLKLFEFIDAVRIASRLGYAIDRDELRPVQLTAAAHFVSLMALNAGYSALRARATDALQFAQIATAGRMTFTDERDSSAFVTALDHLLHDCQILSDEPSAKPGRAVSEGN
jgi:hypothetical protein